MPPVWLASMSDSCPTRAGCCELPRPADAERCSCTAPFADTHRPRPTFADGTDRTTVLPRSAHNSCEITDPAEALSADRYRADCRIFTYRGCAVSAEQFHARLWPNNATRLSGKDWLCCATRADRKS